MRLSTSRTELQQALQKLSKAIPSRSTLPILSCVLFRVDEEKTILRSTDLEITIVVKIPASIEEPGSAAIPLQTLLEITNELPESRITIAVDEQHKVELITETGVYDLMGKAAEEFPALPDIDNGKAIGINALSLKSIIEKTNFAASRDDLKPALTGVYFQFGEEGLTAVATDGHRLVRYILKDFKAEEFTGDVIVPRKFLNLMHTFLTEDKQIQMWMGENHMTAAVDSDTIYTRIIDERFPDYESVIPTDNDKILTVERELLLSAVRRVSIFSNKSTYQIALILNEEQSLITTEDPEKASKAHEELACSFSGEPVTIGYNAAYLRDIVSHIDDENVIVKLKTAISAALFFPETPQENCDITMLLMPIRLND